MINEKPTEQKQNLLLSKILSMPDQRQHDFRKNNETSHSFFFSSVQKPTRISSSSSQLMNIKNPLTAFNYISTFRPISFDTSQSFIKNHFDLANATPSNQQMNSNSSRYSTTQPTNLFEESTVLKINIPIEMIVRTIPQQSTSSQPLQHFSSSPHEKWNPRCNHSTHSWSTIQTLNQTLSKPATSLIRKAQEVFFWS
jgi:hypothetical protein